MEKIPNEFADDFSELVNYLEYISVREANAVQIIKELSGREAKHVLDPTLLLDGEVWLKIMSDKKIVKDNYIFCYLFGSHDEYDVAIEHLREISGERVIIVPFCKKHLNNDYKKVYHAGPLEFLSLIKNAQYIITDSFHATVFSILFSKPFFTLPRFKANQKNSMNSRIYSLLDALGLQERLINYEQVDSFPIGREIDYASVHAKLGNMRKESLEYLKCALEGK